MAESRRIDFVWSDDPEPHRGRTKAILAAHPEVRALVGRDATTAWVGVAVVAAQGMVAWWLRDAAWWWVVASAWLFGAFANHALFVVVHECAHNLVFARTAANHLLAIVANLPQLFPSAISFRRYHLKHHAHQGVHDLDADLPSRWEARLIAQWSIGKAVWLLLFPLFQIARTARLREIAFFDRWVVLNWVVQLSAMGAVWWWWGGASLGYLGLSLFFSVGLHPLGARWIQEHYLVHEDGQETSSYYGPVNAVALNVGYHNEHHDFPSVPWRRLPALHRLAPEAYGTLHAHRSYTRLLLRFLFSRELGLWDRMVRRAGGGTERDGGRLPRGGGYRGEEGG